LKADGLPLVAPVANFSFLDSPRPRPTFLLFPAHFQDVSEFNKEWEAKRHQFEQVWPKVYYYSELVRLDADRNVGFFRSGLCLVKVGN
jgi:hypothetical protein